MVVDGVVSLGMTSLLGELALTHILTQHLG